MRRHPPVDAVLIRSLFELEPGAPNNQIRLRSDPGQALAGFDAKGIPFAGHRVTIATSLDGEKRRQEPKHGLTISHRTEPELP